VPSPKTIVIASDGFKETLTAEQACRAMAEGVRRVLPGAKTVCIPLADGGEGTAAALLSGGGRREKAQVTGPLGDPVSAEFGIMPDGRTAVLEMSAASGFELVPRQRRNPLKTTTYGTGQLIRAAWAAVRDDGPAVRASGSDRRNRNVPGGSREADKGGRRIIVGVGGSATADGGCGALQALGVRFFDGHGRTISRHLSGGMLNRIQGIDPSLLDRALRSLEIALACDVNNPLCGPNGAARVFAPQKGAAPPDVAVLERNLEHLANVLERELGVRVRDLPRTGAAGGLPAGLHAVLGAGLLAGANLVMETMRFADRSASADLIITGEGRLDYTSLGGKVVVCVAEAAKRLGVPVLALVGSTGRGWEQAAALLNGVYTLADRRVPVEEAKANAEARLAEVAEQAVQEHL
jgi:glycerate kinase